MAMAVRLHLTPQDKRRTCLSFSVDKHIGGLNVAVHSLELSLQILEPENDALGHMIGDRVFDIHLH